MAPPSSSRKKKNHPWDIPDTDRGTNVVSRFATAWWSDAASLSVFTPEVITRAVFDVTNRMTIQRVRVAAAARRQTQTRFHRTNPSSSEEALNSLEENQFNIYLSCDGDRLVEGTVTRKKLCGNSRLRILLNAQAKEMDDFDQSRRAQELVDIVTVFWKSQFYRVLSEDDEPELKETEILDEEEAYDCMLVLLNDYEYRYEDPVDWIEPLRRHHQHQEEQEREQDLAAASSDAVEVVTGKKMAASNKNVRFQLPQRVSLEPQNATARYSLNQARASLQDEDRGIHQSKPASSNYGETNRRTGKRKVVYLEKNAPQKPSSDNRETTNRTEKQKVVKDLKNAPQLDYSPHDPKQLKEYRTIALKCLKSKQERDVVTEKRDSSSSRAAAAVAMLGEEEGLRKRSSTLGELNALQALCSMVNSPEESDVETTKRAAEPCARRVSVLKRTNKRKKRAEKREELLPVECAADREKKPRYKGLVEYKSVNGNCLSTNSYAQKLERWVMDQRNGTLSQERSVKLNAVPKPYTDFQNSIAAREIEISSADSSSVDEVDSQDEHPEDSSLLDQLPWDDMVDQVAMQRREMLGLQQAIYPKYPVFHFQDRRQGRW